MPPRYLFLYTRPPRSEVAVLEFLERSVVCARASIVASGDGGRVRAAPGLADLYIVYL